MLSKLLLLPTEHQCFSQNHSSKIWNNISLFKITNRTCTICILRTGLRLIQIPLIPTAIKYFKWKTKPIHLINWHHLQFKILWDWIIDFLSIMPFVVDRVRFLMYFSGYLGNSKKHQWKRNELLYLNVHYIVLYKKASAECMMSPKLAKCPQNPWIKILSVSFTQDRFKDNDIRQHQLFLFLTDELKA